MKVICNRAALAEAMALAAAIAPARTPKPVLMGVLIEASDDSVQLTATDLELSLVQKSAQVQVEEVGSVVVPAAKLAEVIRKSRDDTVSLSTVGDLLVVRGDDSTFKLETLDKADFPKPAETVQGVAINPQATDLKTAIDRTTFVSSRDPGEKFAFNSVCFKGGAKHVDVVATDGKRLAWTKLDIVAAGKLKALVPTRALQAVRKMLTDDPAEGVTITFSDNLVLFDCGTARLLDPAALDRNASDAGCAPGAGCALGEGRSHITSPRSRRRSASTFLILAGIIAGFRDPDESGNAGVLARPPGLGVSRRKIDWNCRLARSDAILPHQSGGHHLSWPTVTPAKSPHPAKRRRRRRARHRQRRTTRRRSSAPTACWS